MPLIVKLKTRMFQLNVKMLRLNPFPNQSIALYEVRMNDISHSYETSYESESYCRRRAELSVVV